MVLNHLFRYRVYSKLLNLKRFQYSCYHFASTSIQTKIDLNPFDYFLVLDFEATCDREEQPQPQEIIEFPCLKLNCKTLQIDSQFHQYVKPVEHPNLSDFCTELTGIVQSNVAKQPNFQETLANFHHWMIEEHLISSDSQNLTRFAFVTCGDWDIKAMLRSQCEFSGIAVPFYFQTWINIKKILRNSKAVFPRGMMHILKIVDLEHVGRHHSGIDDSRNIANILVKLLKENKTQFGFTGSLK